MAKVQGMSTEKNPVTATPETARIALLDSIEERVAADLKQIAAPMQAIMKSMEPALEFVRTLNRQMESVVPFRQLAEAQQWYASILKPMELTLPLPPPRRYERYVVPQRYMRMTDADKDEIAERAAQKMMAAAVDHPATEYVIVRTADGDLYRKSDPRLRLEFGRGKKQSLIIDALIDRRTPVESSELQRVTGFESYKALTNAIAKLNERAALALEYPRKHEYDLATSKPGPGYMLNRKHLIVPERYST